ncbi:MAG: endonuclease III domain-containing protein [Candidatus Micrarchaeota archaeon]|nr:endonuclease III domain-containing protein [Candidatus Micrarchaeota archaeon]
MITRSRRNTTGRVNGHAVCSQSAMSEPLAETRTAKLNRMYSELHGKFGAQGWWPLYNPLTKQLEYHSGDFSYPKTEQQIFEIIVGTVLAQRVTWKQAEVALKRLAAANLLDEARVTNISVNTLAEFIHGCGFYNQKAATLKAVTEKWSTLKSRYKQMSVGELRDEFLSVKGIGRESADCILLYALSKPIFIIDEYARRFLKAEFDFEAKDYDACRIFIEDNLERSVPLFQEYHALIVEWGKRNRLRG